MTVLGQRAWSTEAHLLSYDLALLNFSPSSLNLIWLDCGRWREHGTYLGKKTLIKKS